MAIAASPLILAFWLAHSSSTAHSTVTGITRIMLFCKCKTVAIASAPNATWESPSPMTEKRFSTSVTPSSEEQSAINTPAINAYRTKENDR